MLLAVSCLGVGQDSRMVIALKLIATLTAEEELLQSEMVDMP
jgi:hypothetical protein